MAALALTAQAQTLLESVKTRIGDFPGTVSLYARNLDSGDVLTLRGTDPVRTASTIKLPILCAVFDSVAKGQAKWTDPLTVTAQEKVSGSGVIASEISDGVQLPLRDVTHLMMVLSDNTATNMILERFGADMVNAYLDRLGITTTRSMRKILGTGPAAGWSAAGKLPENQKYGLGKIDAARYGLHPGETGARRNRQPRGVEGDSRGHAALPGWHGHPAAPGRNIIANKTGSLDALRSDVGIVYSKGGRIAMAITVDGIPKPDWSPDNPGSLLIADLAKTIVEGMAKK